MEPAMYSLPLRHFQVINLDRKAMSQRNSSIHKKINCFISYRTLLQFLKYSFIYLFVIFGHQGSATRSKILSFYWHQTTTRKHISLTAPGTFFRTSRPTPHRRQTELVCWDHFNNTVNLRAWGLAGNVDMGAGVVVHYELLQGGYDWGNESTFNMSALIFIYNNMVRFS